MQLQFLLLPYTVLLIAILSSWKRRDVAASLYFIIALAIAFYAEIIQPLGAAGLVLLCAICWLSEYEKIPLLGRNVAAALGIALTLAMMTHSWPGFQNALILNNIRFSELSAPFKMYLNFDKVAASLILFHFTMRNYGPLFFEKKDYKVIFLTWLALLLAIIPIGLLTGYVAIDIKWPVQSILWMINNLFFVCFAEEVVFRGFIQERVSWIESKKFPMNLIAIGVSSLLFGLAHYKGGITYIALSSLAGLFYGFAYYRTGKLLSSITVHFLLNLFHFVFLTYPYLQPPS